MRSGEKMDDYEILIEKAKTLHGGICPGVVIGIKMSIAAMKKLGMNPMDQNKDLVVYVEIDRCMTDGIQAATGCTLGHRTLKYNDYGKFVATFVDISTGKAIRTSARDDKLDSCPGFWTWLEDILKSAEDKKPFINKEDMNAAVGKMSRMSEEELLNLEELKLEIPENDIPGFPERIVVCSNCGEHIVDGKELIIANKIICMACAIKNGATISN